MVAAPAGSLTSPAPRGPGHQRADRAWLNRDHGSWPASAWIVPVAVAAGGVGVLALWWHDTPAGSLGGFGADLTAIGRITGLLGGYLCLVQVVLMARLPWLEESVGADLLARWHAANGRYAICLLAAHPVAIIWGYAVTGHSSVRSETARVVLHYPDVLLATIAYGLLVAVGVVSARAARRRVRYEIWYYVHLTTYVGLALAFWHQTANGSELATHPAARGLWTALYVLVAGLIGWWRVVVPLRSAARHDLRVRSVVPEGPGVVSIWVEGRRIEEILPRPGQFLRWRFLTRDGWWQSHPFSVSAVALPSFLRVTVKVVGDHTGALARLRPGVRVLASGPYGAFTEARRTRAKVLLIAGGIGVTPLRALLEGLSGGPGDITMMYRTSTPADVVLRAELDQLAARRGARVVYCAGPRDQPGRPDPLGPRVLAATVPDLAGHDVYVCGPPGMVAHAVRSLLAAGVPARRIHTESFSL